ncbi:MAG: LysM peptidoglycan-binding domain-containing protein [Chitinispirillia bacterium]|nr:LysM peptidoglycan-binding domain-containing protein [Chitinispirillia bacterium]
MMLSAGCASKVKTIHSDSDHAKTENADDAVLYIMDLEDDPIFIEEPQDEIEIEIESSNIDSLLNLARSACESGAFERADSLLKRAALVLNRSNETAESEWLPLQDYIAEIITIYADLMPPEFSAPEEISTLIFKLHILESLFDELKISAQDSVFLFRLSNKRGIVYDVPVVWNERVRRATLFFMRTRKGAFDRWLTRAGYYLPVMEQMFADSGLPRNLAYLPIIESGFNPHATSHARAAGIWQFIPSTGRAYGLRQNYWIDERRDPLKSTEAAIRYLRKLYRDFGDWHLALAAYNCGENGLARTMRRDNAISYWELKTLPKETFNYVPLYLGSLIIAKNPDVFDFTFPSENIFDPDIVIVNDCIELSTIAKGIEVPLDTLRRMNPHILHWCTPPDMKNVNLYLPKGKAEAYETFYSELPDDKKTRFYRYQIQSGDNMIAIARRFRVPVDALRDINRMKNNQLTAGRFLIIPIPVNESAPEALTAILNSEQPGRPIPQNSRQIIYQVRPGDNISRIARLFGVTVRDIQSWNNMSSSQHLRAGQRLTIYQPQRGQTANRQTASQNENNTGSTQTIMYTVKAGDNLWRISTTFGVTVDSIRKNNNLSEESTIKPGDVLTIPRGGN